MTAPDPVRAALEAAEDAAHIAGCPPGSCAHVAAATITAFHRRYAEIAPCEFDAEISAEWAAAVERAAEGAG